MCTSLVGLFSCVKAETGREEMDRDAKPAGESCSSNNSGQIVRRRRATMNAISNEAILQRNRLLHRSTLPPPPQPPTYSSASSPSSVGGGANNSSCIRPPQWGRQCISYETLERHDRIFGPGSVKDINEQF